MHAKLRSEYPQGRDHSEDLGIDDKTIGMGLRRNMIGRCGLDSSGSG